MQNRTPVETSCGGAAMASGGSPTAPATSAGSTLAPKLGATWVISIRSPSSRIGTTPAPVSSVSVSPSINPRSRSAATVAMVG